MALLVLGHDLTAVCLCCVERGVSREGGDKRVSPPRRRKGAEERHRCTILKLMNNRVKGLGSETGSPPAVQGGESVDCGEESGEWRVESGR